MDEVKLGLCLEPPDGHLVLIGTGLPRMMPVVEELMTFLSDPNSSSAGVGSSPSAGIQKPGSVPVVFAVPYEPPWPPEPWWEQQLIKTDSTHGLGASFGAVHGGCVRKGVWGDCFGEGVPGRAVLGRKIGGFSLGELFFGRAVSETFFLGGLFFEVYFRAVLWPVFPWGPARGRGPISRAVPVPPPPLEPGPGRGGAALGTGPGRLGGAGACGTFHGTFGGTEPGERAPGRHDREWDGPGHEHRGWMEPSVRGHGNWGRMELSGWHTGTGGGWRPQVRLESRAELGRASWTLMDALALSG